jgi:deazaflavin-dependent oxidoreductase (nitroreductase family)
MEDAMPKPTLPEEVRQWNEQIKQNPHLTATMGAVHLLSVPGRRSGHLRSTPVALLDYDGACWLVAGFAEADWVKNIRSSGWGILTKGTTNLHVRVAEVTGDMRASILQAFVQHIPGGSFGFSLESDAPLEAFATIADEHPIFRLITTTPVTSLEDAVQMGKQ